MVGLFDYLTLKKISQVDYFRWVIWNAGQLGEMCS